MEHDAIRAQVDAKIAADPSWAAEMRPQVVALRALNGAQLTASLKKFVEDIQQIDLFISSSGGLFWIMLPCFYILEIP